MTVLGPDVLRTLPTPTVVDPFPMDRWLTPTFGPRSCESGP